MSWIPDYLNQPPYQSYDDYVDPTMPVRDAYETDEQFEQALFDWAYDRNGGRAFAPPGATPYTRDDGSTGYWYTAGTTREETTGEYWANYLNNKWLRTGGDPRGLDLIGLQSWIGLHPEEAQAALMAVDVTTGRPLLESGLIDFLLGSGVTMPDRTPPIAPLPPADGDPPPGTGGGPPAVANPPQPPDTVADQGSWHWDGQRWIWAAPIGGPPADWDNVPPPPPPTAAMPDAPVTPAPNLPGLGPTDLPPAPPAGGGPPPGDGSIPDALRWNQWYTGQGATPPQQASSMNQELNYGMGDRPPLTPPQHDQILDWLARRRRSKFGSRPV